MFSMASGMGIPGFIVLVRRLGLGAQLGVGGGQVAEVVIQASRNGVLGHKIRGSKRRRETATAEFTARNGFSELCLDNSRKQTAGTQNKRILLVGSIGCVHSP